MKIKILFLSLALCFFFISNITAQNQQSTEVRVLTYNILHGANTNGNFDLDIIADLIKKTNPDLVALQEVDFKTNRVNKRDILSELAVKTGLTPVFIKAMDYDGGEYGEGLLSRTSFIKTENVSLPHSPQNEPKAAGLTTLVTTTGDTIQFIATHFDHLEAGKDRLKQARTIHKLTDKLEYPAVLAGDLNDIPGSATINLLEEKWQASYDKKSAIPTYPSNKPNIKIDYVMFYPKHRWELVETKVIQDSIASDHNAVLSVLKLQKP